VCVVLLVCHYLSRCTLTLVSLRIEIVILNTKLHLDLTNLLNIISKNSMPSNNIDWSGNVERFGLIFCKKMTSNKMVMHVCMCRKKPVH